MTLHRKLPRLPLAGRTGILKAEFISNPMFRRKLMRHFVLILSFMGIIVCSAALLAQNAPTSSAVCTFTDGNQISLRYDEPSVAKEPLPMGKVWMPDGVRMDLFTQTSLNISNTIIPPGAYAFYFIPAKDSWTFVINKNVTAGAAYDAQQDLARKKMETEKLEDPAPQLNIYFGHLAPKQCTMRVDYGKVRAIGDINEQ
jgi:Protein of unknown function (DUF2911)